MKRKIKLIKWGSTFEIQTESGATFIPREGQTVEDVIDNHIFLRGKKMVEITLKKYIKKTEVKLKEIALTARGLELKIVLEALSRKSMVAAERKVVAIKEMSKEPQSLLQQIQEKYYPETFWKIEGFDDAIIGVDEGSRRLIYSFGKIIDLLAKEKGTKGAEEHFYTCMATAYRQEIAPIWCMDRF